MKKLQRRYKPDPVPPSHKAMADDDHLSKQPEPGIANVAGRDIIPYLALLQEGFTLPRRLLSGR